MDIRKANTRLGHLLVAHTTSRLIGECHFPLWSSQEVVVNHLWIPEQSGPGSPPAPPSSYDEFPSHCHGCLSHWLVDINDMT